MISLTIKRPSPLLCLLLTVPFWVALPSYAQRASGKGAAAGTSGGSNSASSSASGAAGAGGGAGAGSGSASATGSSSTSTSPYILSFDGKSSNKQGIPFDIPVQLQFFFNQKIKIKAIGYFHTKNSLYRKIINGKSDSFNVFFQQAIENAEGVRLIPITSIDTFSSNPDPTGLPYILNLSTQIYLDPNKNYVFGYTTTVDNSQYFSLLNNALVKFILAHNARVAQENCPGPNDDQESKLTQDYGLPPTSHADSAWQHIQGEYIKYHSFHEDLKLKPKLDRHSEWKAYASSFQVYKQHIDSLYQIYRDSVKLGNKKQKHQSNLLQQQYEQYKRLAFDWQNIYESGYSDSNSNKPLFKGFHDGAAAYSSAYQTMENDYGLAVIPNDIYDLKPELGYLPRSFDTASIYIKQKIYTFYHVYRLALDLAPVYNQVIALSTDQGRLTQKLIAFEKNPCLPCLLSILRSSYKCGNDQKACALLRDSTGFLYFLAGLQMQEDRNPFHRFFDSLDKRLQDPSFFVQDNSNLLDSLNLTRQYFDSLYHLLLINPGVEPTCNCKDLGSGIATVLTSLDTAISRITKLKNDYISKISSNKAFSAAKLFSADSYTYSLTTRQGFALSADIGVIDYGINSPPVTKNYGNHWDRVTPYFGVHWNFRYVNSDIPFSKRPYHFFSHTSFFLGVTILSAQETGKFNNLFGSSALLGGVGYKVLSDGLRIVAGTMLVKKLNPDPLISTTTLGFLPFVGISYDFNTLFSNMVSLIK